VEREGEIRRREGKKEGKDADGPQPKFLDPLVDHPDCCLKVACDLALLSVK
jgi:hypothetical protein